MKSLLTNNLFMTVLSVLIAATGFIVSWFQCDFTSFARSGALLVGLGIIVLARTFIAGTELHESILGAETGLNVYTRDHYAKLGEQVPEYVYEQERNLFALGRLGPSISFVGTVVWGFGDLLNKVW